MSFIFPGFHEAIGDVIALSVATPKHMAAIGVINATDATPESTLNYLMQMALEKVQEKLFVRVER